MDDSVEVTFSFQTGATTVLDEAGFTKGLPAARQALQETSAPFGQMIIRGGGQPELAMADELVPLVDTVMAVLRHLHSETVAVIGFYSQPGAVRLERDGDAIKVRTGGSERRYAAAALLPALKSGCDRLITALDALERSGPDWAEALVSLKTKSQALDREGIPSA